MGRAPAAARVPLSPLPPVSPFPALSHPHSPSSIRYPLARAPRIFDALPAAPATGAAVSSETPPSPRATVTATPACALCEEQKLLIEARTALGRGEFERALAPLRAHQARYPRGELTQEREALRVRTLAASGRSEEARAALLAFEAAPVITRIARADPGDRCAKLRPIFMKGKRGSHYRMKPFGNPADAM